MTRSIQLPLCLCLVLFVGRASADEPPAPKTPPGERIAWIHDLPTAFAKAKADQAVLMICINAKSVAGEREEAAAKGLRDVIYVDPRVVQASRSFVCAFLTPSGSSNDYGELRALGIDGAIISPQHIFVHPDGKQILLRKQYWSYGQGESGVKALIALMAEAEQKWKGGGAEPAAPVEPAPEPAVAAPDDAHRAEWIARMLQQVRDGGAKQRDAAIANLVQQDKDGDCVQPLLLLIPESKKDTLRLVALIRGLGRDGLERAALPIAKQLGHKNADVRGNAAVSLEYIGSHDKKVISALKKFADKEKDEALANHGYRALGRSGSKDAKVRVLLLKKSLGAKSEYASYGPAVGLAYFEGDKKAARGVEKVLKRIGVPGSRRGGGRNAVKRSLVSWTLASIGDKQSGVFVREELMAGLEHVQAPWVGGLLRFWETVARTCEGERELLPAVEDGVRGAVGFVKGMNLARYGAETRNLMDAYRKGREAAGFTPRGDNVLNDQRDG